MTEKHEMVGAVKHMKKSGVLRIVIIAAVVGLLLITLGSTGIFGSKEQSDTVEQVNSGYDTFLEYKDATESEIEQLCRSVSGVSEVSAVVFFADVGGSKYAQNSQTGSYGEKSEYVIIGSGSSARALYLGESLPIISGVGIVCRTGGSEAKRAEITALIAATYGLSMTRVYVCEAG